MKSPFPSLPAKGLALTNRLFRRPERPRYFEVEAYQLWLEKNGRDLYEHFYSKYASFSGRKILDLGCGYGGKIVAYSKQNPALICGVDINTCLLAKAKNYAVNIKNQIEFLGADVYRLPFKDSTFDLVISDDGFDHFKNPERVVDEIVRVLKPGGTAFLSFVPYYTTDCSHMGEYLRVPWHHVFFSRKTIKRALELIEKYEIQEEKYNYSNHRSSIIDVFNTFENDLSRLSIKGFKNILTKKRGMKLVKFRKQSRNFSKLFTYFPIINELFTHSVYCVLNKKCSSQINSLDFIKGTGLDLIQDVKTVIGRAVLLCKRLFAIFSLL